MTNEMWLYLVGQIIAAAGIYTAIRVDLKGHAVQLLQLKEQLEKLETKHEKMREARKCPV